jgi:NAD(P)-dependent dehydrogenase (short-subunit alcohol dehydrogenase family)
VRFKDKVALITAGASGIGKATGEIIASEGGIVVVVDTDQARLDKAVASLGARAQGHRADALDQKQVQAVVDAVVREHKRIDILVNAVGGSTVIANPAAAIDELPHADWKKLLDFNLEGTFNFTHAVVPVMRRQASGKIVNLASIAGRGLSDSSSSAYATAKGGIIALTKKLGRELGPAGINVNAIAPSLTLTERLQPVWDKRSPVQQKEEVDRTPLRRVAVAADQARVICFLASSDADFVTGVTIDVTGGI